MVNAHLINEQAEHDYHKARTKAFWADMWARLNGSPAELVSFERVRRKLELRMQRSLGLHEIPLDHIVGSVGRYKDFNRRFEPRATVHKDRWKSVAAMTLGFKGLPPIDVYKVGDCYFVVDGHHRVSVARAHRAPTIEAYVTEFFGV